MSEIRLAGHKIDTPVFNAAGAINGIGIEEIRDKVKILAKAPSGAVTYGSITVPFRTGNEKDGIVVYHHDRDEPDKEKRATYNSMGLPNIGLRAARKILPELVGITHDAEKPFIVSVSPVKEEVGIGNTLDQVDQLVSEMLETDADLIEINTSCPNEILEDGGRKPLLGYDLEGMRELVKRLSQYTENGSKFGVKLPPYMTAEDKAIVPDLATLFNESGVFSYLVTSNTIPNQKPLDAKGKPILTVEGNVGGMSGPATKLVGREQLRMWRTLFDGDIVRALGVDNGEEVEISRQLGAQATSGVTFLWEGGPNWGNTMFKTVDEWSEAA